MERLAATGAGLVLDVGDRCDPGQVLRQRPAIARRQFRRRRFFRRGTRQGGGSGFRFGGLRNRPVDSVGYQFVNCTNSTGPSTDSPCSTFPRPRRMIRRVTTDPARGDCRGTVHAQSPTPRCEKFRVLPLTRLRFINRVPLWQHDPRLFAPGPEVRGGPNPGDVLEPWNLRSAAKMLSPVFSPVAI